jgi:hypothetical protein
VYTDLVRSLRRAYAAAEDAGIEDQALSKSINDILIADYLGHFVSPGGAGSDAYSGDLHFEYKCSTTNIQANFHLGKNRWNDEENILHLRTKFQNIEGAYFTQLEWGEIRAIYYCPMQYLLPVIEEKVLNVNSGQLNPQLSWEEFTQIEQSTPVIQNPNRSYPAVADHLRDAMQLARDAGMEQGLFGKGGHNHLFLAQSEGHQLSDYGGGPDAHDINGNYEYKISMHDWKCNFNFGARKSTLENQTLIRRKCDNLVAAYIATRRYGELTRIVRIPAADLQRLLLEKEAATIGNPMNLQLTPRQLAPYQIFP